MLGSSICIELLLQGYKVKAACLPHSKSHTLDKLEIEKVYGDIMDYHFLLKEMKDCDYVIHVAAITWIWPRKSSTTVKVNYQGTYNIQRVVSEYKMKRLVHIGSASSFGYGSKENPGNEERPYKLAGIGMDYLDSKYKAQQMLLNQFRQKGLPVVIINPTFMIGPFDSGPSSGKMIISVVKHSLRWYCSGGKNFVYSKDVAIACVNALKLGELGECYIAGNANLTYGQFFELICRQIKQRFFLKKAPGIALMALAFIHSAISRLTGRPPKLSFGMAILACKHQYYDSKKAQIQLKMPQTSIAIAIEESLKWFKKYKYI